MKRTDKPTRHSKLAEQLTALMAYRTRPEPDAELAPVPSNWRVDDATASVNPEDMEAMRLERRLEIVPSIQAIMRNVADGETERNEAGQIIRIGDLEFSDGNRTEKAYTTGPEGNVITFDCRMPTGALLRSKENADAQSGGAGASQKHIKLSNYFFADMFGTADARYISGTRNRRTGKSYRVDESREILRKAIINTTKWPTLTRCPPGLPCGSPRVADSFLGMQKGKKGESGSIMWQDLATSIVNREIWEETLAAMPKRDVEVLDAAADGTNLTDVGTAAGQTVEYARRRGGRRVLMAANDNLRAALQKAA